MIKYQNHETITVMKAQLVAVVDSDIILETICFGLQFMKVV
jgi:hypothetical protein